MKYIWFIYNGWLGIHYPTNILYNTIMDAYEAGIEYGYSFNQVGVEKVDPWYDDNTHELTGWEEVAILVNPLEKVFEEEE